AAFLETGGARVAPRASATAPERRASQMRVLEQPPPERSRRAGVARRESWLYRLWPVGAGGAVALGSLALLAPARQKPTEVAVPEQAPIAATQTAATDCAVCHARQTAEWRRSVMAHAVKSPLFNALESLIEEQVGRDNNCPNGAGIL